MSEEKLLTGIEYIDTVLPHGAARYTRSGKGAGGWQSASRGRSRSGNLTANGNTLLQKTRLVYVSADLSDGRELRPKNWNGNGAQHLADVLHVLPNDAEHILMSYGGAERRTAYTLNLSSRKIKKAQSPYPGIQSWLSSPDGVVIAGWGMRNEKTPTFYVRRGKRLKNVLDELPADAALAPLGIGSDPNTLYIYRVSVAGHSRVELFNTKTGDVTPWSTLYGSDNIQSLIWDYDHINVVGYVFKGVSGRLENKFLNQGMQKDWQKIKTNFPKESLFSVIGWDKIAAHALIKVYAPNNPGLLMLYDNTSKKLMKLGAFNQGFDSASLSKTVFKTLTMRDGTHLPVRITLPPNVRSLTGLSASSFVVIPEALKGMPATHQYNEFIQFLATRGHGVVQVPFRARANDGEFEWGDQILNDVQEVTSWIVGHKYANPNRICIVGKSFGGYVALMSAARKPNLYKCTISIAGVSDFSLLLESAKRFYGKEDNLKLYIAALWEDKSLREHQEPVQQAGAIKSPILLIHGGYDSVVNVNQSKVLAGALAKVDAEYTFKEIETGNHEFDQMRDKIIVYQEIERFLEEFLNE